MANGGKAVLVALSADLEVAHRAYLKSLGAAGYEVVSFSSADDLLRRAKGDPALVVVGAATGLPGVAGLELLRRLGDLTPTPTAPVLLLHGASAGLDSPLRVLRKWSEARQALGLDAPRQKRPGSGGLPRQPLIKLKSVDPTLELAGSPQAGTAAGPDATSEEPKPPIYDDSILLTEADRIDEPDETDEVAEPPQFGGRPTGGGPAVPQPPRAEPDATDEVSEPPAFAPPPPLAPTPAPDAAPTLRPPTPAPAPPPPKRRSRVGLVVVLVLLGLGLLAGAAVLALRFLAPTDATFGATSIGPAPTSPREVLPPHDSAASDASVVAPGPATDPADAGRDVGATDAAPGPADGGTREEDAADEGPSPGGEDAGAADEIVVPMEFDRNDFEGRVSDRRALARIARTLTSSPEVRAELIGHSSTDEREDLQDRLGMLRARSARDVISGRGPSRRRFTTSSAGAAEPVRDASGAEDPEASRRVVMRIERD